jgi:dTDP-4-amino-4,6-dideoxygalactose transaminase
LTSPADILFANGTSALAAALMATGCRGRLVAIPAAVCPSVPAAVMAAGATPLLLDIEMERLGLCPEALAHAAPRLAGAVAVHAYGIPCRISEIQAVCRHHGLALIEDCAQAEGAGGTGGHGDVSVFSYGTGKILDLGGGGMATAGDPAIARRLSDIAAAFGTPADPHAGDELGQMYKFLYNRYFPGGLAPYDFIMPRLMAESGARLLGRADDGLAGRIRDGRARLADELARRRAKAERYRSRLDGISGLAPLPSPAEAAPWRFNVALEAHRRDAVFKTLLAEGRRVSTWYPSAAPFMGGGSAAGPLPAAERLGAVILNLPLDDATSPGEIDALCDRLIRLVEGA